MVAARGRETAACQYLAAWEDLVSALNFANLKSPNGQGFSSSHPHGFHPSLFISPSLLFLPHPFAFVVCALNMTSAFPHSLTFISRS